MGLVIVNPICAKMVAEEELLTLTMLLLLVYVYGWRERAFLGFLVAA